MKRYLPLLAILTLLGAFAAQVATAAATPSSGPLPGAAFALQHPIEVEDDEGEEDEAGDNEFGLEECEAGEFEFEEAEATEAEEEELEEDCEGKARRKNGEDTPFVTAPEACRVSRAESTITAVPAGDQVRLAVHYRTWAPTAVTVSLKLRDGKGAVGIEHATRHLGDHGVLHLTTKLGGSVMERALRASEFDVSLLAPGSPDYCGRSLEQRLRSVKHTGADAPRVYSSRT